MAHVRLGIEPAQPGRPNNELGSGRATAQNSSPGQPDCSETQLTLKNNIFNIK